jgi:hypothetical protein
MFLAAALSPPADVYRTAFIVFALGIAAYGVVDASKAFWGGVSNRGFGDIKKVVSQFIPASSGRASAISLTSVLATLRANWLNGMDLADQKSAAKALIKLNLNPNSASTMAAAAGVDANALGSIAGKLSTGEALTPIETDVFGRFDLLLTASLDQGYQRGDQRYRNSAKLLAVPVAAILSMLGAWAISSVGFGWDGFWKALVIGLLASPLAPVAKDLASAIQAGSGVAFWKG